MGTATDAATSHRSARGARGNRSEKRCLLSSMPNPHSTLRTCSVELVFSQTSAEVPFCCQRRLRCKDYFDHSLLQADKWKRIALARLHSKSCQVVSPDSLRRRVARSDSGYFIGALVLVWRCNIRHVFWPCRSASVSSSGPRLACLPSDF